jgi:hypothetical protein
MLTVKPDINKLRLEQLTTVQLLNDWLTNPSEQNIHIFNSKYNETCPFNVNIKHYNNIYSYTYRITQIYSNYVEHKSGSNPRSYIEFFHAKPCSTTTAHISL